MRMPSAHCADEVKTYEAYTEVTVSFSPDPVFVLSRPVPFCGGIRRRFKLAWMVFTGKADVLRWIQQ